MNIEQLHHILNEDSAVYISYDVFVGKKVHKMTSDGWSEPTYIISSYENDSCGEGCCDGFTIEGFNGFIFYADQLKLAEDETIINPQGEDDPYGGDCR